MYCFSNSFFVVKCVLVSLKVLDHLCLNTSLVQLKKILLAIVENLVTYIYIYIENENFEDFTRKDGER